MKARHIASDFQDQNKHSRNLGFLTLLVTIVALLFGLGYGITTALQGIMLVGTFTFIIKQKAYHLLNGVILAFALLAIAEFMLFGIPEPFFQDIFSTERTRVIIIWNQVTPFIYIGFKLAVTMLLVYNRTLKRKFDALPEDIKQTVDPS